MNKIFQKNTFVLLFQAVILSLVPVELYRTFLSDTISVGPISLQEAFLFLAVGVLFCGALVIAFSEKNRGAILAFFVWALIFLTYLVLHARNAAGFDATLIPAAAPSFSREVYYVLRMYGLPSLLFWSAVLLKIPTQKILQALLGVLWMLSVLIITTTLLGISFASYADGNLVVRGGYFSWFSSAAHMFPDLYTSKGPFHSANDLASALFGLVPLACYMAQRRGKVRDHILLFLMGVSCVTVGTKIASLGFFVIVLSQSAGMIVLHVTARERKNIPARRVLITGAIFIVVALIFLASPGRTLQQQRDAEETDTYRPTDSISQVDDALSQENDDFSVDDTKALSAYLHKHAYDHFINHWFLEIYPVENDPVFWADAVRRAGAENADSRAFKLRMIHRVFERDQRASDRLWGIGFTSGVPYAERDYCFQWYLYGGIGVLVLIAPVIGVALFGAFALLHALLTRRDTPRLLAFVLSLVAFCGAAYYAGHVFDTPFPTYLLFAVCAGFVCGRNLNEAE